MSERTDATRCKVCGGPFTSKRVWIDGQQYHSSCAVMSYPPHTHADYQQLSEEYGRLRSALEFYAQVENYRRGPITLSPIESDRGEIARAALLPVMGAKE